MPQKNSFIFLTLLSSVGMIMLVVSLFHLSQPGIDAGLVSSFFEQEKMRDGEKNFTIPDYRAINPATMRYFPQK